MSALFSDAEIGVIAEPELAPIEGTPAQIPWAEDIRAGKLRGCRKVIKQTQEYLSRFPDLADLREKLRGWINTLEHLESLVNAGFWIDHRENLPSELLDRKAANPGNTWHAGPERQP